MAQTREDAMALLRKHNTDSYDFVHFLESEAIMAALAKRLEEDESEWSLLGLMHDIDWGLTKQQPEKHVSLTRGMLEGAGFNDRFITIIESHIYGWEQGSFPDKRRSALVEHALACAESVTGLIHAYALMRKGIDGMEVSGLKKKLKDKRFAAGVNRETILECEKLGLTLDEFLDISIRAVQRVKSEVGL